ncbi:hypothetical protein ABFS83_03G112900 [Erythranthe nasuta]
MCNNCDAKFAKSGDCTEQENGHSVELNPESCEFCGETNYMSNTNQESSSSCTTPSISPTLSLRSRGSDMSVDADFDDRFVDDSTAESSQEDSVSSSKGRPDESNGFSQADETRDVGKNIETAQTAEDKTAEQPSSYGEEASEEDAEFWIPPEPEEEDDDVIGSVANYDDDYDDEGGDGGAYWSKPSSLSSFGEEGSGSGSGSYKFKEEKVKKMEDVKNGKFRALVSQLMKSVGVESSGNLWVDIVTSLSWEAATFVKPDATEGAAMDPDGYVKIKCVATGSSTQSQLIKGLVFKKHAAHKHMATKYKNPRLLLIHGSLDLSSGGFSSFSSMQQDKDNLKSITDMIDTYHPNVILVEKSVSRDIQESIFAKGITLVIDMKLHRLERVARCIGSPILAASGVAIGQKLRQCDSFRIEKFVEELAGPAEGGKKQSKTLMFLEGAPTRLGCTILLMGANSDELKRIKCVVRCAVVMAYHLMLETFFLLDQTAMLSTISPTEAVDLVITHDRSGLAETDESTLDIPISNGFHETESSEDSPSLSFEVCDPATFPGLSISTTIQKVMNDSFPEAVNHREEENSLHAEVAESSDAGKNLSDDGEEKMQSKDDINSVLDSESILVLMSSRNASRGTICESSHFSHIKFYRSFDVPLGKFLQDNLLNQRLQCKTCDEPSDAHIFYYAHHNEQLTIQVRRLPAAKTLLGENEGKLWMWSRCGKCKNKDGTSKSTKRVLLSTAARGFSFGKFLELSFSSHSALHSLSSCGHSFHKDFLYFFGLGPMVAMFKYSPVVTYSVSLPPQEMEFNSSFRGDFLKNDSENVYSRGISMFLEIEKSLMNLGDRYVKGSSKEFSAIVEMLKQEKAQFEVEIQNVKNASEDNAVWNLLSLNRLRLDLLLESCTWDHRLHALLSSDLNTMNPNPETEIKPNTSSDSESHPTEGIRVEENGSDQDFLIKPTSEDLDPTVEVYSSSSVTLSVLRNPENDKSWIWAPFAEIRREYIEDLRKGYLPKFEFYKSFEEESTSRKLISDEGSRMHIPLGLDDYIVSDYEDEFSSIIACALTLLKDAKEEDDLKSNEGSQNLLRLFSLNSPNWSSFGSLDSESSSQSPPANSLNSNSFDGLDLLESLVSYGASHPEVSMGPGKNRKYSVLCVYEAPFRELRDRCCPSEEEYIASLSRCKNWDAQGGKSKSFFAKTLDDRFIIKEIKRTEFDSFMKFATNYFEYMNQCSTHGNQTCLAKIVGIYQVVIRGTKNGRETRHDLLVMENLSFGHQIARQYDLKGALYARFSTAGDGSGDVLLDQNFVNDMNVSPLYVSRKSKRTLQRAVYNDTLFLNSINVMDYSLLVGVDIQKRELVCGIIDYVRQYTWDKQLENWVKSSLVLPKNQLPTIVSPKEYKKRFRKFIDTHFLSVPDHWCSRRSSNPCKLCGPAPDPSSAIKSVNQDEDSEQNGSSV